VVIAEWKGLTDAEAIERSLSDPEAFGVVFERHVAFLHRFARVRVGDGDAGDLVASTFAIETPSLLVSRTGGLFYVSDERIRASSSRPASVSRQ